MDPIRSQAGGVVVRISVVPGASHTEVKGRHGDAIKIRVAAPPEGGKANQAVCRLLEDLCGGNARIERGASSRSKVVFLEGTSLDAARTALLR